MLSPKNKISDFPLTLRTLLERVIKTIEFNCFISQFMALVSCSLCSNDGEYITIIKSSLRKRLPFATVVNEIDSQSELQFIIIHSKFISVICTRTTTGRNCKH